MGYQIPASWDEVLDRPRFEARPLTPRPGGLWGVFRIQPYGSEECLAYGSRERCEAIAARLQAREDGR